MGRQLAGQPTIFTGTATTTAANVVITHPFTKKPTWARFMLCRNRGAQPIKVFLPGMTQPLTFDTDSAVEVEGPIWSFTVQASSSTSAWEALAYVV